MKPKKQFWKDTLPICIGQVLGIVAVNLFFLLLNRFDLTVLLGSVSGAILAAANYCVMYLFAIKAADKATKQDVAGGQKLIQLSYMGRMVSLLLALILLAKSQWCNVITLVIPLALNRPILTINELLQKKGGATE